MNEVEKKKCYEEELIAFLKEQRESHKKAKTWAWIGIATPCLTLIVLLLTFATNWGRYKEKVDNAPTRTEFTHLRISMDSVCSVIKDKQATTQSIDSLVKKVTEFGYQYHELNRRFEDLRQSIMPLRGGTKKVSIEYPYYLKRLLKKQKIIYS